MNKAIFIIMLLLVPTAVAVGISPGSANLNFQTGRSETIKFTIHNTEGEDLTGEISVQGPLKEHLTLSSDTFRIGSDQKTLDMEYNVVMPEDLLPGRHTTDIMVRITSVGGAYVGASPGLITALNVHVPYPGKYAKGKLNYETPILGEDLVVHITVFNLGIEDISKAEAKLTIKEYDGTIAAKTSTSGPVDAKSAKDITARIDTNGFLPGSYDIEAVLNYDGNTVELSKGFSFDDFMLTVTDLQVGEFKLGDIAGFDIIIKNMGNRPVDATTEMQIFDGTTRIARMQGLEISLGKEETGISNAYWDTDNVETGQYDAVIITAYEGRQESSYYYITVTHDGIIITGEAMAIPDDEQPGYGLLLAIVLILIIAGLYIHYLTYYKD